MSGGRLSCLARNGGVAARGRKSDDDIAAGNRGAAGLRLDQAINETGMVRAPGTKAQGELAIIIGLQPKTPACGKTPLCLQSTRTPTESTGRQTPALASSDAPAEMQAGPNEPSQPPSPIKRVEAKNAAQISSGRGQELRRRKSPSGHTRCRGREDCKPCPGCGVDGDGAHNGENFPPEI